MRLLIVSGNALTLAGCSALILWAFGALDAEAFAIGPASGLRVMCTVAIGGCLLSAVGYGIVEHFD